MRAYARRKLALDLEKVNSYTLAITRSLRVLLGEELSAEIDEWAQARQSAIRVPFDERYRDTEKELKGLLQLEVRLRFRAARRRLLVGSTVAGAAVILLTGISVALLQDQRFKDLIISSSGYRWLPVFVAVITFLAVITRFLSGSMFRDFASSLVGSRTSEWRLNRLQFERMELEEQLRKLSPLRRADLETLMKQGRDLATIEQSQPHRIALDE